MDAAKVEARDLIELIAGPMRLGENVKSALARVARATGLGDRRVRGIWNGEARRIDAPEMDRLRRVALDVRTRNEAEEAYRVHIARLTAARTSVRLSDEEPGGDLDHGRVGLAGAEDRALAQGEA